jgi:hypothetical protein
MVLIPSKSTENAVKPVIISFIRRNSLKKCTCIESRGHKYCMYSICRQRILLVDGYADREWQSVRLSGRQAERLQLCRQAVMHPDR